MQEEIRRLRQIIAAARAHTNLSPYDLARIAEASSVFETLASDDNNQLSFTTSLALLRKFDTLLSSVPALRSEMLRSGVTIDRRRVHALLYSA